MMHDITNHLLPWDTVKKLLRGAWAEGYDAGFDDARTDGLYDDGYDSTYTPNPYDQEDEWPSTNKKSSTTR